MVIRLRNKHKLVSRFLTTILVIACLFNVISCASAHNHVYGEWEVTEESTCEDEGLRVRTCECGHKEEEVIARTKHDYVCDHGYPATCTSTGLTDGAHCSVCDDVLTEQKVIPKIAHVLEDIEAKAPTFTQSGLTAGKRCSVCKEVIVAQSEVEKLREQDYGYKVEIGSDEHVSVYVYTTQDYDAEPVLSNVAFARDSSSGEFLKNGNGQVNFELRFDDGYYLKDISLSYGYNALKTPTDTKRENTYRITKIKNDLVMFVSSQKQVEHLNFSSYTDDGGSVLFSWSKDSRIKYTMVKVTANDETEQCTIDGNVNEWMFNEMDVGVSYKFDFTPYDEENKAGLSTSCSRYFNPEIKAVGFPRVEITTHNFVWPTCDYVGHPVGCIGSGITNNDYEQCIVNIYDKENNCVYNSSDSEDYTKAKIKIRGNTSAYGEKTPYKIKLNKKSDLLANLLPDRADKSYAHKDWLLLKNGQYINQVLGSTVSKLVKMDYTPAFSYVECYVNGDYRGLYVLCESVSQGNGDGDEQSRCAISDEGFIVEMDAYWWNEDLYLETPFCENSAIKWTFKYPDSDDINEESNEYLYIKEYITKFDNAIMNGNDSYKNYIDLESFAKWLLAHDILGSFDAGGSNIYVTKYDSSDTSVLKMGPLWDFDCLYGTVEAFADIRTAGHFYYKWLIKDKDFNKIYNELFNDIKGKLLTELSLSLDSHFALLYDDLIEQEHLRWGSSAPLYSSFKSSIMSWYERHLEWLSNNIIYQ